MGKSGKKPIKVSKKGLNNALYVYLENANPAHISLPAWTRSWSNCHGETRSSSTRTFYIMARQNSQGHYMTRIVDSEIGYIEGTEVDWGTREPSLSRVLRYYRALFGIEEYPSSSNSSESGTGGGGRGGGRGGNGKGGGSASGLNGPYADGYGGYFYNDSKGNYYPCDQSGKIIDDGEGTGHTEATYYHKYRVYRK
ncbi:hypothetical protein QQX98_002472 [Neonectria punicea]|uniref:Uncharacterized protein n=1 Tax=Neonectria punicea TaxID=979145 RepID=A0ABR1HI99_9HYPO